MRIAFFGDSLTQGVPGCSYFAILRERLPGDTLVNLGRGNDTVASLHRRVARMRFRERFDVAFLWVGVNDVGRQTPYSFWLVSAVRRQLRARDLAEFRARYGLTLDILCRNASRVIAVSPLLKGESIESEPNRELEALSGVIEDLVANREQVEYLNLRPAFYQYLAARSISGFLPKSTLAVVVDALTLRSAERVDRQSAERGLHVTLDGIHLNHVGAGLVAEAFAKAISRSG